MQKDTWSIDVATKPSDFLLNERDTFYDYLNEIQD